VKARLSEKGQRVGRQDSDREGTDVVVVGAGPVGMTAAALLAARGVRVTVLERNTRTSDEPKAISIDDESLRVYQWAGLAEHILKIIVPGTGTRYYDAAGRPVFQTRAAQPCRFGYPFKNPFAQPDLERELAAHLRAQPNVMLHLGTAVTALAQDADGVELQTTRGPVRARFVLGCDGGRSTIRARLGIGMTGRSYGDAWLVADLLGDRHDERYGMHHGDPDRPHVIIPGRNGRCRYEFLLRPGEGEPGVRPDLGLVRRLLAPYREVTPEQVERLVTYRFHAVVADRWRVGNAFLLGDAAHMMPPFAGQGLNSGIRDAANVAWKIADVVAGRLAESALDTYETERRPHAEATVRLSERLGRIVMTTQPRVARNRDRLISAAVETDAGRSFFEQMRFRPPHVYTDGLLSGPRNLVGVPVGQPRVFDAGGRRIRLLDDALGPGWSLVGVGVGPADVRHAAESVAVLSPSLVQVPVDDRMPAAGDLLALIDLDGRLDAEFAAYRGRLVLLRPDRFVAATWPAGQTPDLTALHLAARVATAAA
jgi:3-(3-hydroxy-phenyl)propionate hydroxylase